MTIVEMPFTSKNATYVMVLSPFAGPFHIFFFNLPNTPDEVRIIFSGDTQSAHFFQNPINIRPAPVLLLESLRVLFFCTINIPGAASPRRY